MGSTLPADSPRHGSGSQILCIFKNVSLTTRRSRSRFWWFRKHSKSPILTLQSRIDILTKVNFWIFEIQDTRSQANFSWRNLVCKFFVATKIDLCGNIGMALLGQILSFLMSCGWPIFDQGPSSYGVHIACQIWFPNFIHFQKCLAYNSSVLKPF